MKMTCLTFEPVMPRGKLPIMEQFQLNSTKHLFRYCPHMVKYIMVFYNIKRIRTHDARINPPGPNFIELLKQKNPC